MPPSPTAVNDQIPVFVYGTLRRNLYNYDRVLAGHTVAEVPATLKGARLFDYHGNFPFMVRAGATPTDTVVGEVMFLNPTEYDRVVANLDCLEGFNGPGHPDNMYERVVAYVTLADGALMKAYTYFAASSYEPAVFDLPLVESGDWNTYSREPLAAL